MIEGSYHSLIILCYFLGINRAYDRSPAYGSSVRLYLRIRLFTLDIQQFKKIKIIQPCNAKDRCNDAGKVFKWWSENQLIFNEKKDNSN